MAGIELSPRKEAAGARAMEAFHAAFDRGVLIRVTADIIALSPPLIISEGQIDHIVETITHILEDVE